MRGNHFQAEKQISALKADKQVQENIIKELKMSLTLERVSTTQACDARLEAFRNEARVAFNSPKEAADLAADIFEFAKHKTREATVATKAASVPHIAAGKRGVASLVAALLLLLDAAESQTLGMIAGIGPLMCETALPALANLVKWGSVRSSSFVHTATVGLAKSSEMVKLKFDQFLTTNVKPFYKDHCHAFVAEKITPFYEKNIEPTLAQKLAPFWNSELKPHLLQVGKMFENLQMEVSLRLSALLAMAINKWPLVKDRVAQTVSSASRRLATLHAPLMRQLETFFGASSERVLNWTLVLLWIASTAVVLKLFVMLLALGVRLAISIFVVLPVSTLSLPYRFLFSSQKGMRTKDKKS
jgi:hypothetical protein